MAGNKKEPPARGGLVHRGVQTDDTGVNRRNTVKIELPRWLFWGGAVFVALFAAWLASDLLFLYMEPRFQLDPAQVEDLGVEGVSMFRVHDRDDDGFLSLEEFEPLAHRLLEVNVS